jgi:hypothetical protein
MLTIVSLVWAGRVALELLVMNISGQIKSWADDCESLLISLLNESSFHDVHPPHDLLVML